MAENKKQLLNDSSAEAKPTFVLKAIQELKGFDFADSNAFVFDMETGI